MRTAAMQMLLLKNDMKDDLPEKFHFDEEGDGIYVETRATGFGKIFIVDVLTEGHGTSDMSCEFVFNSRNECILWKPNILIYAGDPDGLYDLNGDGFYEKFVKFRDSEDWDSNFIEVWSLKPDNIKRLLSIKSTYHDKGKSDPYLMTLLQYNKEIGKWEIKFVGSKKITYSIFSWSKENNKFEHFIENPIEGVTLTVLQ